MERFIIRVLGEAGGSEVLGEHYLAGADVEAHEGRGKVDLTDDVKKAMRFESMAKAFTFWSQQSKTTPLRPDGKPNKPLTAYTVEITVEPKI